MMSGTLGSAFAGVSIVKPCRRIKTTFRSGTGGADHAFHLFFAEHSRTPATENAIIDLLLHFCFSFSL
jgi:hypothetical protein